MCGIIAGNSALSVLAATNNPVAAAGYASAAPLWKATCDGCALALPENRFHLLKKREVNAKMRSALQVFAGIVLGIAALLSGIGLLALINDPPSTAASDAHVLEELVGLMLFAGMLWMLGDISNALHPTPTKLETPTAVPSAKS
jgi:hypothetical protein